MGWSKVLRKKVCEGLGAAVGDSPCYFSSHCFTSRVEEAPLLKMAVAKVVLALLCAALSLASAPGESRAAILCSPSGRRRSVEVESSGFASFKGGRRASKGQRPPTCPA